MISALLSFAFLLGTASLLTGCGTDAQDSSSAAETSSVTIVKDAPEAKICTLKNGGNVYFNGVEFEDAELCSTVTGYCVDIQDKYEPLDEKGKEEMRKDEKAKGGSLSAELDNGVYVYMAASENYINISGTYYDTADGEAKKVYAYLSGYMEDHISEVKAE